MKKFSFLLLTVLSYRSISAQNVGIGVAAPTEKLHVSGNIKGDTLKPNAIKLTPNAGNGKILTSDANGNASWQAGLTTSGNVGYGVWGDCATNNNISGYQPVDDSSANSGTHFGESISVSGDFTLIGSYDADVNGNNSQGTASIYKYNGSTWDFFQKITDPTGAAFDLFGASVSISGNFLVCGSRQDQVGSNLIQGSACVFRYNGSSWVFLQKITDPNGEEGDRFGGSVSISGNYMVIGAYTDDNGSAAPDRGSVSFYRYNGSSWVLLHKSVDPDGAQNDNFGFAVSISGDYAVVSSMTDDDTYTNQGSVTVYKFNGASSFTRLEKIFDESPAAGEQFGSAVSNNGSDIFVGVSRENSSKGKVNYYRYLSNGYFLYQSFFSNTAAPATDYFGCSVFASGNYLLIGSLGRSYDPEFDVGDLTLYQKVGNFYHKIQSIRDPASVTGSLFGKAVTIDGTTKHFLGTKNVGGPYVSKSMVVFGKIN